MSDVTSFPPTTEADIQVSLALVELTAITAGLDATQAQSFAPIAQRLVRLLTLLREIDPTLPDVTAHAPGACKA